MDLQMEEILLSSIIAGVWIFIMKMLYDIIFDGWDEQSYDPTIQRGKIQSFFIINYLYIIITLYRRRKNAFLSQCFDKFTRCQLNYKSYPLHTLSRTHRPKPSPSRASFHVMDNDIRLFKDLMWSVGKYFTDYILKLVVRPWLWFPNPLVTANYDTIRLCSLAGVSKI